MRPLAFITGGTRGIGRAITAKLIELGFDVYFTYKNNHELALKLEQQYPNVCKGFAHDHTKENIQTLADQILKERVPEVIVNNIGMNQDELFIKQDLTSFWDTMQLNFGSVLSCCKAFLGSLVQQRKGHIINITSVAAIKPKIGNSAYGVSKVAIERFSKTLALETARFNVRVNCVSPAYVKTDLLDSFLAHQSQNEFYKAIPMRKVLLPEEVANLVGLLASNQITTTGSIFYVGNGENIVG